MKIVDYIILTSDRIQTTERTVGQGSTSGTIVKDFGIEDMIKEKIAKGYQPYGFLNINGEYQYTTYTQAMVKYSVETVIP